MTPEPVAIVETEARRRPRRCVVERQAKDRDDLIRFALGPDGAVVPDVDGRLPGRGVWVSASRVAVATAASRGLFARALKRPVATAPDLAERVEALLEARCLQLLGLANRAGELVIGFDAVRETLRHGRAAMLIEASDGAEDGRRKLRALASGLPVVAQLDRAQLGSALGRESCVHAALVPGGLARRLEREAQRLARYRGEPARDFEIVASLSEASAQEDDHNG